MRIESFRRSEELGTIFYHCIPSWKIQGFHLRRSGVNIRDYLPVSDAEFSYMPVGLLRIVQGISYYPKCDNSVSRVPIDKMRVFRLWDAYEPLTTNIEQGDSYHGNDVVKPKKNFILPYLLMLVFGNVVLFIVSIMIIWRAHVQNITNLQSSALNKALTKTSFYCRSYAQLNSVHV